MFFSAPRDGGEIEQSEEDSGKQQRERAASGMQFNTHLCRILEANRGQVIGQLQAA